MKKMFALLYCLLAWWGFIEVCFRCLGIDNPRWKRILGNIICFVLLFSFFLVGGYFSSVQ